MLLPLLLFLLFPAAADEVILRLWQRDDLSRREDGLLGGDPARRHLDAADVDVVVAQPEDDARHRGSERARYKAYAHWSELALDEHRRVSKQIRSRLIDLDLV